MRKSRTAPIVATLVVLFVVVLLGVALLVGARSLFRAGVSDRTVLELDLEVDVIEDMPDNLVAHLVLTDRAILRYLVDALHRAAADDRVVGVVARVGSGSIGFAATQELRDAIAHFRGSGKPAIAHAETFGEFGPGNGGYYLAAAFDEVHLQPSGDVGITGINVDAEFFRGVFDKYDVDVQMDHRHEYKNAMNVYTETSFTDAHRESFESLIGSLFDTMLADIARDREMDEADLRALVDRAPILGYEAVEAGLVDALSYRDEVYTEIESRLGSDVRFLDVEAYRERAGSAYDSGRRIALVLGDGAVTRGESAASPSGETNMGSDTITRGLRLAIDDPSVEAILLRVNSPGGSYVASDAIRREVDRARTEGIPVIVSMGNVAASGGYFVAMNADRIVAQPGTITGSIGVLGGKLVVGGFFERFGVRFDNVHVGENAEMWSPVSRYDDGEWERLEAWLDRVYTDFTMKAAEGRGLPIDSLLAVARGRVWTGTQAHAIGLVDTLGGYDVALALAREAAGIDADEPVRVERYPASPSFTDLLLQGLRRTGAPRPPAGGVGRSETSLSLEAAIAELLARAGVLSPAERAPRLPGVDPLGGGPLASPEAARLNEALSGR